MRFLRNILLFAMPVINCSLTAVAQQAFDAHSEEDPALLNHENTEVVHAISVPVMCAKEQMQQDGIVRLSKVEVYPQYLEEYMKFATEVGEISLRTEPGVLTMYAVQEKDNPCMITILETYASQDAYKKHIASPHFQKYKQGTLHMVKSLVLSDQTPLNPSNQINNFIK